MANFAKDFERVMSDGDFGTALGHLVKRLEGGDNSLKDFEKDLKAQTGIDLFIRDSTSDLIRGTVNNIRENRFSRTFGTTV